MNPVSSNVTLHQQEEIHHLQNLQNWNVVTAYGLAAARGIKLTQEHIEVLYWLRAEYDQYGKCEPDIILKKLEKDFNLVKAGDYLKKLFPVEPFSQWFCIAGLPVVPGYYHLDFH